MRISLLTFLKCVSYFPIAVGAAIAIHFEAWLRAMNAFDVGWEGAVQRAFCDAFGLSTGICRSVWFRFAIGRVPSWVCFALITFSLAYVNSKNLRAFAVVFLLCAPIGAAMFEYPFLGNWQEVILSLTGLSISSLAFACAVWLRRIREFPLERMRSVYVDILVIGTFIGLSIHGWYIFSLT